MLTFLLLALLASTVLCQQTRSNAPCLGNMFTCTNKDCIPHNWECDEDFDCPDGSDEEDCPERTCSPLQFACNDSTTCVSLGWRCDDEKDCPDGSDESPDICVKKNETKCPVNHIHCLGSDKCLHMSKLCDTNWDCSDGFDEGSHCRGCSMIFLTPLNSQLALTLFCGCPHFHKNIFHSHAFSLHHYPWKPW
uniref:low-density lipoprotein receptor-related protein 8-like n=1 Tax=Myxine glutinosa TaxID=7769 RepID=UPI00359027D5